MSVHAADRDTFMDLLDDMSTPQYYSVEHALQEREAVRLDTLARLSEQVRVGPPLRTPSP